MSVVQTPIERDHDGSSSSSSINPSTKSRYLKKIIPALVLAVIVISTIVAVVGGNQTTSEVKNSGSSDGNSLSISGSNDQGRPENSPSSPPTNSESTSAIARTTNREAETRNSLLLPESDMRAWQDLYDTTDGPNWFKCSRLRSNPCDCIETLKEIVCEFVNGVLRITTIDLSDNRMRGVLDPRLLRRFTALRGFLDFSTRPGSRNENRLVAPNGAPCIYLPECYDGTLLRGCKLQSSGVLPCFVQECRTDGGYASQNTPCRIPFIRNGNERVEYFTCLPFPQDPPFISLTSPPRQPMSESDGSSWCPTVPNYSTGVPETGRPNRLDWGFCSCRLVQTVPILPTESPVSVTEELAERDLEGWKVFFDATSGPDWLRCSSSREDPCNSNCDFRFQQVVCEFIGGELRMTRIVLRDNRLNGYIPSTEFTAFGNLDALEVLDVSNSVSVSSIDANILRNPVCVDVPRCLTPVLFCNFARTELGSANRICESNDRIVNSDDLQAWQRLYDQTGGPTSWFRCSGARRNPCNGGCAAGSSHEVTCVFDAATETLRIRSIVLRNNQMVGTLPTESLGQLPFLRVLDLSNDPGIGRSNNINLPSGFDCLLGLDRCFQTGSNSIDCDFSGNPIEDAPQCFAPTRSPTQFPTSPPMGPGLSESELEGWRVLYDALDGPRWITCSSRNDPCDSYCPNDSSRGIRCETRNGQLRITQIILRNNRLMGSVPGVDTSFGNLNALEVLDLSNRVNTGNANFLRNSVCINLPICLMSSVTCDFSDAGLGDANRICGQDTLSPTSSPIIPSSGLPQSELEGWQAFYDNLNGPSWLTCSSRENPCDSDCPNDSNRRIVCSEIDGILRITEIVLRNNRLSGLVPGVTSRFGNLNELRLLDLSNLPNSASNRNFLTNPNCINLPRCLLGDVLCDFDNTGLGSANRICDVPTLSPTLPPSSQLPSSELRGWQEFYDNLDGSLWLTCSSRSDPCNSICPNDSRRRIRCSPVNGVLRITEIVLQNNRLNGRIPGDSTAFGNLNELRVLDLSNEEDSTSNFNTLRNEECVDVSRCLASNVQCDFSNAGLGSANRICNAPVPTSSPTSQDTLPASELQGWRVFYDSLNGDEWLTCASRSNPCSTVCENDSRRRIRCAVRNGVLRIVEIVLINNRLRGKVPGDSTAFANLNALERLDLSNTNPDGTNANRLTNPVCIDVSICLSQGVFCDFDNTGLGAANFICDDDEPRLAPLDQNVWETLYDQTNGENWYACSSIEARRNPCGRFCGIMADGAVSEERQVQCEVDPDPNVNFLRITSIVLKNNRMSGPLPTSEIGLLPLLRHLDLSNIPGQARPNDLTLESEFDCIAGLDRCFVEGPTSIRCNFFGNPIATAPRCLAPTRSPTLRPTPRPSPTPAPVRLPMNQEDLLAWQVFYTAMDGPNWLSCASRNDPCGAFVDGCNQSPGRVVQCSPISGEMRITQIILQNNRLNGVLPIAQLSGRWNALEILDLSNDVRFGEQNSINNSNRCINLPRCYAALFCDFSNTGILGLCAPSPTRSPVASSPTIQPSTAPIIIVESGSPTVSPTVFPTTASPNFGPPTTASPTVESPTTPPPTSLTQSPTASPLPNLFLLESDLIAWRAINNALNSSNWQACGGAAMLNAPCQFASTACATGTSGQRVVCSRRGNVLRLTEIKLPNNRLRGWLPDGALRSLTELTLFDVSNVNGVTEQNQNRLTNSVCVDAPRCYSSSVACVFRDSGAQLCDPPPFTDSPTLPPSPLSPTLSPATIPTPSPTPGISQGDLNAWRGIYSSLQGESWLHCTGSEVFDNPCSETAQEICNSGTEGISVECETIDNEVRITQVILRDNRLRGWLPESTVNAMTALEIIDFASSQRGAPNSNVLINPTCLDLPRCYTSDLACIFTRTGAEVCEPTSSPTTLSPTGPGTMSPTPGPTRGLIREDLTAWQAIYATLNGRDWAACNQTQVFNNPCSPEAQELCDFPNQRVVCDVIEEETRIVEIRLQNNRASGWLPESVVQSLTALEVIDFSNDLSEPNLNTFTNQRCLDIPRCDDETVCLFINTDVEVC